MYKCACCGDPADVYDDESFECRRCGCQTLEKVRVQHALNKPTWLSLNVTTAHDIRNKGNPDTLSSRGLK